MEKEVWEKVGDKKRGKVTRFFLIFASGRSFSQIGYLGLIQIQAHTQVVFSAIASRTGQ